MAINPAIPVNGDDLDADPIRANFAAAAALETDYNAHKANVSNPHNVSAAQIGLGNVENKSSATIRGEITSGNVTTALGYTPENAAQKGAAGGYAPLDGTGKVASTYLPSYVDDVLEFANLAAFPGTGETGKMYVALDTNNVYRWSGSAYVEISGSPGSTDAVPEGASNLYFTAARVLATVLSGLSTASSAVITAADTVLSALGKLQKQISDNLATLTSHTSNTSNPHSTTAAQVGAVPTSRTVNGQALSADVVVTTITGNAGTATALQTVRNINGVAFNGTADITINAVDSTSRAPTSRTIATTAPLTGGGDLSVNRTLAISAATTLAAGSMSAADKTKLDAITGTNTGDETGARIATLLHAASAKTTLVDADEVNGTDSAASFGLIRTTWANVRAYLLSYFAPKGAATSSGLTMSTARLLGRNTAGTGAIEEITLGTNLSFSGTTLNATGGGSANARWLGAGEFIPRVTNGAGIDGQEFSTNRQNLDYLAFDPGTQEFAQASFDWPSGYTTFTANFYWTAASGSGAVVWRAAARCYADGDAIDQAFGTAQSVTDTLITATNNHASSATSAVTPSGTVSAGNLCVVQIDRDATNGSDTLAVDGRLIGVRLVFA